MASQIEKEAVFYCHIGNVDGLDQAVSKLKQEQAEGELANGVRIRVRRTEFDGRIDFECTIKSKVSGAGGVSESIETTTPVDEAFYKAFCKGAKHILKKTRYVFRSRQVHINIHNPHMVEAVKLGDVNFEVDVYQGHSGDVLPLVKIDVEVDSVEREIKERFPDLDMENVKVGIKLASLPFRPTDIINAGGQDEAERKRIDEFWEAARLPV